MSVEEAVREVAVIGAPLDLGAGRRGVDMGPSAIRYAGIESLLTVTGGDVVYSAGPFTTFAPEPLPPVSPAWSPVAAFGGYQR